MDLEGGRRNRGGDGRGATVPGRVSAIMLTFDRHQFTGPALECVGSKGYDSGNRLSFRTVTIRRLVLLC